MTIRRPALPLSTNQYATLSRADARKLFSERALRRAWGLLFCVDGTGLHWTLLGDQKYVIGLRAASRTTTDEIEATRPPSPLADSLGIEPTRQGVSNSYAMAEFPLEAFRPEFVIYGWPDEWPAIGRTVVLPWRRLVG